MLLTPSGRRVVVLLATLLGVTATANLGAWQLRRAAQKVAVQTAIESRAALPWLAGPALAHGAAEAASQYYRRVTLHGRWAPEYTVFLENRQMQGRVGFYVVTPLVLDPADATVTSTGEPTADLTRAPARNTTVAPTDAHSDDRTKAHLAERAADIRRDRPDAVLVQRGWVPRDQRDRTLLPSLPTPAGSVEVQGRIAPPPARLYEFASSASGVLRQNLDVDKFGIETGLRLAALSVQQTVSTASADDGLMREWPRPAADVQKHYGYAFQWFALSALMAGLYGWFQFVRPSLARRR